MKTVQELDGIGDGAAAVRRIWTRALEPAPDQLVWQWADIDRRLSSKASAEEGRYRTSRFPFLREPMEALSPSSPVDKVVFVKAAQMGVSEAAFNLVGFSIARDPCAIAIVVPTDTLARDLKKTRIDPMVELSPELGKLVRNPRATRDAGNTANFMEFPNGNLRLCGANSPAALRGWTAKKLICDDLDVFPPSAGDEGDVILLGERATLSYQGRRKLCYISTPTIEGRSRICIEWEDTDQSYYHVPCPRCGERGPIAWSRATNFVLEPRFLVVFDSETKNEAEWDPHLECQACKGRIENYEREEMIQHGTWVPTVPERSERARGFHISRLYAPAGMGTLTDLVRSFRTAKRGGDNTLRVFFNRDLGEPWREKGERPAWKPLYDRRETYKIGTVPRGAVVLTCGVDVQGDRLELEVVGWGEEMESWSVDYQVLLGRPSEGAVWKDLEVVLAHQYPHEDGALLPIRLTAIDSSDQTQDVYNWVRRQSRARVRAIKGNDERFSALITTPQKVEVNSRGKRLKRGLDLWHVSGPVAKTELYGRLRLEKPLEGEPFPPGYCHFPEYGPEHFRQLTAEELRPRTERGFTKYVWHKVHERNEVLDCRVYARGAAAMIGLDRWGPEHWSQVRAEIGSAPTTPRDPSPAPSGQRADTPARPPAPPRGWLGRGGSGGWFGR